MFGLQELLTIFIAIVILLCVPALIGFVIWRVARRSSHPTARLAKLDQLLASSKITAAEHERQRGDIISGI